MSRIVVKATRPVLRRGGASNRPDLFDLIKDNKSLDFLPNYVTLKNGEEIDKAEYVDMVIRTEAYIRANKRLPAIVYRMSKLPDYKDSTMKLFINTFNFKGSTIDEALAIIAKKK